MKKFLFGILGLLFAVPAVAATLPAGYTELKYIESSGTQIIVTDFVPTWEDTIEADYELTNLSATGDKFIMGGQPTSVQEAGFWVETYGEANTWYIRYGSNRSASTAFNSSQKSGTFILSKSSFVVNGTRILTPAADVQPVSPMSIFGRLGTNGKVTGGFVRFSNIRVKRSNVLTHNLIPAKNSSGVVGLYDTVGNRFYTNQGTGEFIAGPEVSIRIATTAYNSARFSPVVTELNDTIATIRSVVTNTINQTKAIADLQATKQTRPDETCPAGKKCLLVEDDAGQPHWYEIIENAD